MDSNYLDIYPEGRDTTLNGKPVTIRYGGHLVSGVHSGTGSAPMNFEAVKLVFPDGSIRGAELPTFWRTWDDETLRAQLPNCRIF